MSEINEKNSKKLKKIPNYGRLGTFGTISYDLYARNHKPLFEVGHSRFRDNDLFGQRHA